MYLAAIIDWHSKAVLSYKISNTMDASLAVGVLEDAIAKYGPPEDIQLRSRLTIYKLSTHQIA